VTPTSALDALVCGYVDRVRAGKILVIMKPINPASHVAYVDESGCGATGNILLLSACIQTYPVWADFSNDWDAVLHLPPSISAFHMRKARKRAGEFAGWKAIDLDRKVIALTDVIMRHRPRVLSCWVSERDYKETVGSVAPSDLHHAYFTCFCVIVIKVAEYQLMRGITTPADYIFDDHDDIGNEALLWYAAMKDSQPSNIQALMGSSPVFRNDEDVLPLQAADLIAWHKRRRKEIAGLDPEVAASLRIDELPNAEVKITREMLEKFSGDIADIPNVELFREGDSIYKKLKRAMRKGKKEF
jgi:Protein of unknown function (DUF3800)